MEELDLKELFNIFWSRKVYIAIITAIFFVVGIIYTYIFVTPDYESTITIILAKSSETTTGEAETITTTDLTLNEKLVSTYSELIKSKNILNDVINHLQINKTVSGLRNVITVSAVKDTDLIQIKVKDGNPQMAQTIVSEIADVFIEKVANGVYKINNVQIWDKAEIPTSPYNINHMKDLVIFIFIGVVVSALYALTANMLDTTVKSKEDIEKKIGVSVLTVIPVCDFDFDYKTVIKGGRK